jgi:Na+/proline symporter
MEWASLAALAASLVVFVWIGLRAARGAGSSLDDYLTARSSQHGSALGLSFLASGMGAWILFAPPEVGAFVGPIAVAGYAIGAALPFVVLAWCGRGIRRHLPHGRSIAEFAGLRYGVGVRRWVALLAVAYMLVFLTAELTAIGAIAALLGGLPPAVAVIGVALATLIYTAWGGLRASLVTDRWQAWLLLALLLLIGGALLVRAPQLAFAQPPPMAPAGSALAVALTLIIAVTAANLFHQGYWQRLWAARDERALDAGAALGAVATVLVVLLAGAFGMLAVMAGTDLGQPPLPFFALLADAPAWLTLAVLVLAVALVASSVDTLLNGIASLAAGEHRGITLAGARWLTVLLMVPVVVVALQGYSVLRLFLIADLLCATAVVPLLLGLWRRASAASAIAGCAAGLVGAVLPGWVAHGSFAAGVLAATFPGGIPTLAPFAGALLASTVVSVAVALLWPRREAPAGAVA